MSKVEKVKERVKTAKNYGGEKLNKVKKVPIVEEFRDFIARGNVLDLAVGVIVGAAFQNLVTSLTNNIISPILGCLTEVDFSQFVLKIGKLNLRYGAFLTDIINFIIMAFVVFLIIKFMNRLLTKKEEKAEEPALIITKEEELLTEIRDLIKKNVEK